MENDQDTGEESKLSPSNLGPDTDRSSLNPDKQDGEEPPIAPPHEFHKLMQAALKEKVELKKVVKDLTKALAAANELILKKQDEFEKLQQRKCQLEQGQNSAVGLSVLQSLLPLLPKQEELEKTEDTLTKGVPIAAELRFPEEIWEKIMENLSDPEDLWSASNSCHLVQNVLNRNKYLWIFDMVFPILFSYLDKDVILTFRLVCKRWNGVVDNHFENHPSLTAYSEENWDHQSPPFRSPMREKGIGLYAFGHFGHRRELEQVDLKDQDFLLKMRHHPRNPFIGRSLIISKRRVYGFEGMDFETTDSEADDDDVEVYDEQARRENQCRIYWRRVAKFLEVFGEHIWYLTFSCFGGMTSRSGHRLVADFLARDVFYLCPNLRKLRVVGYLCTYEPDGIPTPPPASKLHTLHLDNGYYANDIIPATLVANYFQQLKGLDIWGECWLKVSHLDWGNLAELFLNLETDKELAALLDLKVPNLKKLGLKLQLQDISYDKLELLFRVIIKLSETAPHFNTFRLYNGYSAEAVKMLPPHLYAPPNVTTLEFQCSFMDITDAHFAFLVRFPFIKNLNIYWPKSSTSPEPGRPDVNYEIGGEFMDFSSCEEIEKTSSGKIFQKWKSELIQVRRYMFVGRMYESNIWMLLPRLNVFTFQNHLHTRHGYEELTSKRTRFQGLPK